MKQDLDTKIKERLEQYETNIDVNAAWKRFSEKKKKKPILFIWWRSYKTYSISGLLVLLISIVIYSYWWTIGNDEGLVKQEQVGALVVNKHKAINEEQRFITLLDEKLNEQNDIIVAEDKAFSKLEKTLSYLPPRPITLVKSNKEKNLFKQVYQRSTMTKPLAMLTSELKTLKNKSRLENKSEKLSTKQYKWQLSAEAGLMTVNKQWSGEANLLKERKRTEKALESIYSKVILARQISDKISIYGGLAYIQEQSRFKDEGVLEDQSFLVEDVTRLAFYNPQNDEEIIFLEDRALNGNQTYQTTHYNHLKRYELALGLDYELNQKSRWKQVVGAELLWSIQTSYEGVVALSTDTELPYKYYTSTDQTLYKKRGNIALGLHYQLAYKLQPHWTIFAKTHVYASLHNRLQNDYPLQEKPLFYGVSIGGQYSW